MSGYLESGLNLFSKVQRGVVSATQTQEIVLNPIDRYLKTLCQVIVHHQNSRMSFAAELLFHIKNIANAHITGESLAERKDLDPPQLR